MLLRYILIFLILPCIAWAKVDIDSLLKLQQKAGSEEDQIRILNDISTYYFIKDDSAKYGMYARKALILAGKISRKMEVDALNHLSFVYSYTARKTISRDYAQKAIDAARSINYSEGINEALFNLGFGAGRKDVETATRYYIKAINMARKDNNDYVYALSNTYMGLTYADIGNYNAAVKYMITAQKTFDKLLQTDKSLKTLYYYGEMINALGNAYRRLINLEEAKLYYQKYLDISYRLDNDYGVGISFNNLGVVYTHENNHRKAIESFNRSMAVFEGIGIDIFRGTTYNNIATIYSELKDYIKSGEYYMAAFNLYVEQEDSVGQAMAISNLADVYFILSHYDPNNGIVPANVKLSYLRKAENAYKEAIILLKDQDKQILLACYLGLSEIYDSLGLSGKAYSFFKMYTGLKDTLNEQNKAEELSVITQNYKNEKMIEDQKRREQEEQKVLEEKRQRKYNLQYTGMLIFLMFFLAFVTFYNKHKSSPNPGRRTFLARKISTSNIESMVFVALLFLFEFIGVFTDPYINRFTNGEPVYNLLVNGAIALAMTPLDTSLEKMIRKRKAKV